MRKKGRSFLFFSFSWTEMDGEKPLCLLSLLMHLAYSKSPPYKIILKLRYKWHIAMQRRCNSLISDMVLDSGSAFTIKLVSFKCSGIFRKNVKWATCFCPWDIHINFLPKEVFWLPSTQGASAITLSSNINSPSSIVRNNRLNVKSTHVLT